MNDVFGFLKVLFRFFIILLLAWFATTCDITKTKETLSNCEYVNDELLIENLELKEQLDRCLDYFDVP